MRVWASKRRRAGDLFRDEHGFTTTSMVLSLLITLALVFTTAQVYRVNSAAAEVQDVADAAALAAENQVAEFMIVARFCDSVVLSLSLTGVTAMGVGVVALCVPPAAGVGEKLVEAGRKVIEARDAFSDRANSVLDKLQKALPFFAAAASAGVAAANNGDHEGANYLGVAMLVPADGEDIAIEAAEEAEDLADEVDEHQDEIRDAAEEAEEASKEANEAKARAFARDCGDAPGYCMYERADSLAGLGEHDNPQFASVDAWSFSVALDRARAYYEQRLANEAPENDSVEERARSALRERFYAYAAEAMADGYVYETDDDFTAYFPHLPANTAEMRESSLYTDAVYPVTEIEEVVDVIEVPVDSGNPGEWGPTDVEGEEAVDGEGGEGQPEAEVEMEEVEVVETFPVMHAWSGCPEASDIVSYGSIADMEAGDYRECPACAFAASSLGKVAAATSSVETGFEYHYRAVAEEAALYEEARRRAEEPKNKVKERVEDVLDKLKEALESAADKRIAVSPPGRFGAIAFVVNAGSTPAAAKFASGFVSSGGTLGPRAAIAASTLVDEGTDEGRSAIGSLLDGLREDGGALVGAAGIVLDVWSRMLVAYADGHAALVDGVEEGLNAVPLAGASGLGTWAAEKLEGAIAAVGLQPAEVGALKPVIVNSAHVAAKGEGSLASGLVSVKQRVIAHPIPSTSLFSGLLSEAEKEAVSRIDGLGDSVEIASIELLGGAGPTIPVTIPIPAEVKDASKGFVSGIVDQVRSFYFEVTGVRVWE